MKQFIRIGFLFILSSRFLAVKAQTPPVYNSADIYLQLKKLHVLGSVLYIAAHPDDENTRLLAYLSKEKQYRTGYLSLTRGDGGQNLIGDEQGVELGLIRTQELLDARRIDGAEQFFSRAYDFGFSKSAKEAMETWDHDKILGDVVWVIRKFQPDVIITRFPGDERAGHGHHTASALLANEAFKAAADSSMFPEQFKAGVQPWQAKRILWNTFNFGGNNTIDSTQLKIDVGVYNSLLGKGYGEIASDSRSQHKSQGFGVPAQRGQSFEYFLTTGGDVPEKNLMEGVNETWSRVKGNENPDLMVNAIIKNYDFEHPEKSIDSLVNLYNFLIRIGNGTIAVPGENETLAKERLKAKTYWYTRKAAEVKQLILNCAGFFAEATTRNEYAVSGDSIRVEFAIDKRADAKINLVGIRFGSFDSTVNYLLPLNKHITISRTFEVSKNKPLTQPYWLADPMLPGSYDVKDQLLIGKAENDAAYNATFILELNGTKLFINRPVMYKHTDPVKGEIYQPVVVIPPVIVSVTPNIVLTNVKPGNEHTDNPYVKVDYKSNFESRRVPVTVSINQGTSVIATKDSLLDMEKGKTYSLTVPLKKDIDRKGGNELTADVFVTINGRKIVYTHYLRMMQYDHIPDIHYYYQDRVKLINEEIKTSGKNIGYIVGAGDKVPQALQQMGYTVTYLNEQGITSDNLKKFDAVIAGVRAYNTNTWLGGRYDVLMHYVQEGGNYIVQYNTNSFVGPFNANIGPYPFVVGRTRVTDEHATVKVLQTNSRVLNYPNKITDTDFANWIQERSIYQADQADARYEAPLAMHDANEPETSGSLIVAKYGKGNFVYTGLVFFRELPAGVPGAYRLMANLIALPQNQ